MSAPTSKAAQIIQALEEFLDGRHRNEPGSCADQLYENHCRLKLEEKLRWHLTGEPVKCECGCALADHQSKTSYVFTDGCRNCPGCRQFKFKESILPLPVLFR